MRTRLGLKVLGLSALVIGVMAIGTTGVAQAEKESCWGYESGGLKCFTESLEAKPLLALENNTGTLLIGNVNLEILCTTAALVGPNNGGKLSKEGKILLGKVQFGGCISLTKTTLALLPSCKPSAEGVSGRVVTENGEGLIVLHLNSGGEKEPVVLLKAHTLTLAKIFLGEECAIAEEIIVGGELVLQDRPLSTTLGDPENKTSKEMFETHAISHLIREHAALHLMHVGINTALIDGSAKVTLDVPHSEFKWAGKAA